ncbi:MAG: hypothetical protein Q4A78_08765 [Peptostreptococcaceae bacterium]|nr:hypothetical protein [Peptostreptococcaceae bacterium]
MLYMVMGVALLVAICYAWSFQMATRGLLLFMRERFEFIPNKQEMEEIVKKAQEKTIEDIVSRLE